MRLATSNRTGWRRLLICGALLLGLTGCGGPEPERSAGCLDLLPLARWDEDQPPAALQLTVGEGAPLLGPGWEAADAGDGDQAAVVSNERHASLHLTMCPGGSGPVKLRLRLRNPWPTQEIDSFLGTIVSFNGRKLAHLIPSEQWADHAVELPAGWFRQGTSEVVLTGLPGRVALSGVDLLLPGPQAVFTAGDTTRRALVSAAPLVVDLPRPLPAGALLDVAFAMAPQLEIPSERPHAGLVEWRSRGGEWETLLELETSHVPGGWTDRTVPLDGPAGGAVQLRCSAGRDPAAWGTLTLSWPGAGSRRDTAADDGLNLILILADTLRADRLGAGGSAVRLTPSLDALAAESVQFRDTLSQAASTVPSVSSLFSGRYFNRISRWVDQKSLPAAVPLFAETLAAGGCRTLAVVTNPLLLPETGFARGFDEYHHLPGNPRQFHGRENLPVHQPAEAVNARFFQRLPSLARGRFFAYLHYMDPHDPYLLQEEGSADRQFSGGRLDGHPWEGWLGPAVEEILEHGGSSMVARDREMVVRAYDNEVRCLDRQLGLLLAQLRRHGLLSRTVVAVVADHGEEFLEHGLLGHGHTVYEELLRVPALVRFPRRPGFPQPGVVPRRVELLDVAATLLDVMDAGPPEGHAGKSLLPLLRGVGTVPEVGASHFETRYRAWVEPPLNDFLVGVEADGWKLVRNRLSGVVRLYRLDTDPGETTDLSTTHSEKTGEMMRQLDAWLAGQQPLDPGEDEAPHAGQEVMRREIEALKALGYMQ